MDDQQHDNRDADKVSVQQDMGVGAAFHWLLQRGWWRAGSFVAAKES